MKNPLQLISIALEVIQLVDNDVTNCKIVKSRLDERKCKRISLYSCKVQVKRMRSLKIAPQKKKN